MGKDLAGKWALLKGMGEGSGAYAPPPAGIFHFPSCSRTGESGWTSDETRTLWIAKVGQGIFEKSGPYSRQNSAS